MGQTSNASISSDEVFEAVIVGGGLVGSILAVFLQQRGARVHIFEKRPDMRIGEAGGGRSINLVATSRGLRALEQVGLKEEILALTIPVYGRMMHDLAGELTYQSYSKDNTDCNYSISRGQLNATLLSCAERAGATLHFDQELLDADFSKGTLRFSGGEIQAGTVYGTDGAGSALRQVLVRQGHLKDDVAFLEHGYKELLIDAGPDCAFPIEENALHIWPRGEHMLMALPNLDGSFTVTLYLANEGPRSFSALNDNDAVMAYFQEYYVDSVPLMPRLLEDFAANPTGLLGTVRSYPWHLDHKVVLLGDAAHAIVPFFGQGMNAGFEGCTVLMECLDQHPNDLAAAFASFTTRQKPNADAIADMALENFVEMRDRVGDAEFLLRKQAEAAIGRAFPEKYISRYSMVTHSLIPYAKAQRVGEIQAQILEELCANIERAEDVDLEKASALIDARITPAM